MFAKVQVRHITFQNNRNQVATTYDMEFKEFALIQMFCKQFELLRRHRQVERATERERKRETERERERVCKRTTMNTKLSVYVLYLYYDVVQNAHMPLTRPHSFAIRPRPFKAMVIMGRLLMKPTAVWQWDVLRQKKGEGR